MRTEESRTRTRWLVQTAILMAIIFILAFTPLGYLKVGTLSISFLTIPVVIGAVLVGPASGIVLGAVFGLTSFAQCFGLDPFGTFLLGINPFLTFIMCVVPRVLMGWLVGLIFKSLHKIDRTKLLSFAIASLSGALINTVLFLGALILFFGGLEDIQKLGPNVLVILWVMAGINAVIEAVVCTIVGTAITKPLYKVVVK